MDYKTFAQSNYDDAICFIEQLADIIVTAFGDEGEKFDKELFCMQFDCILQFTLLEMALADNKFKKEEFELVRDITKYGNLISYVNNVFDKNLEWKTVWDSTAKSIKGWLESFKDVIIDEGSDLVSYLTVVKNSITENDYVKQLADKILAVVYAVINADGKMTEKEENYFIETAMGELLSKVYASEPQTQSESVQEVQSSNEEFDESLQPEQQSQEGSFLNEFESILGGASTTSNSSQSVSTKFNKGDINCGGALNYKSDIFAESVVYIETEHGCGTGFVITQDGYVITCAHVAAGRRNFSVKITEDDNSKVVSATLVTFNKEKDFAIIKMQEGNYKYCSLATQSYKYRRGKDIVILGYPFGRKVNHDVNNLSISLTKGYISSIQKGDITNVYLDISAKSGNSGSPVIDCESGEVIGILCGSLVNKSGELVEEINYMRPISYFWELFTR